VFLSCCLPFFSLSLFFPLFYPPYLISIHFTFLHPLIFLPLPPHFLSFCCSSLIAVFLFCVSLPLSYIFVSFFPIFFSLYFLVMTHIRGRDSSVGIANRYGLDGPCIETRWGAIFSSPFQTDTMAHPAPYNMGVGSFPGV
jgi:hypothetical protein